MHVRTWSFYAFILVFPLSGGIYLSALPDMEGETALMQEDLLMAGLSSFLGISMAFPLLFLLLHREQQRRPGGRIPRQIAESGLPGWGTGTAGAGNGKSPSSQGTGFLHP